ncbi:lysylphosphatidylglycerol synthase transmembrane domain-containing protein [Roseivirga sp.]|uniref:lysylphosphatidylglycerol synthase transmembrane domain-containing protein n=1 Tax=Roseivirga sp. TaxID=1964215 RepID=UPI002B2768F6|nr:lysylphosphatidylglycerol synthase transmembrane domain-containing protein [Roseivirga sp.]
MKISLKDILKLILSLGITGYILYNSSKTTDWNQIWEALKSFKYEWILLSVLLSLFSHGLRAYRWAMLLGTHGKRPSTWTAFLAVMACYLGNMAIPRLGEVARCTIMKEEQDIPVTFSLGTVITDRLLDLFMLMLLAVFLLAMQFNLLKSYFSQFIDDKLPFLITIWPYLVLAGIMGFLLVLFFIRKSKKENNPKSIYYKIKQKWAELISGIKAIKKVQNPLGFWLSTLGIWVLYFAMLYVISFGYTPTAELSFMAGIAVLVMGSLGMAAPVNNGIGAYQALVASILVVYGISHNDGYVFAVVSHGSQVVSVILFGFLSLLILNFRKKRKKIDAN